MFPGNSPASGAQALARSATAALARPLRCTRLFEWANRPLMELAEMQPVTAAWWRERRTVTGDFFYLALGDSTAQGIGASNPGRSYVGQLADRIEARLDAPIAVTNLGVSGAPSGLCVRDQLPRARAVLARRTPDLVTLAIGANDIARWDPRAFHRNLSELLDALPEGTLVAELPSFHLPWNERRVREANRIIHTLAAARGTTVVPLYAATRARGLRGVLTEFAQDAFHPNDRGYEIWADTFWPAVESSGGAGTLGMRPLAPRVQAHADRHPLRPDC